jgi:hypothetical protein
MEETMKHRILTAFEHIKETSFLPESVEEALNTMMAPNTFEQLAPLMTESNKDWFRQKIMMELMHYDENYQLFITDIQKMQNVFSFDVDYV